MYRDACASSCHVEHGAIKARNPRIENDGGYQIYPLRELTGRKDTKALAGKETSGARATINRTKVAILGRTNLRQLPGLVGSRGRQRLVVMAMELRSFRYRSGNCGHCAEHRPAKLEI